MDWVKFVEALDVGERKRLEDTLYHFNLKNAEESAKEIELTKEERETAYNNKIQAILMLKNRTNCGLRTAKIAVERFLGV